MKAVVCGFGSIGQRHARILGTLGAQVSVVSRHAEPSPTVERELGDAVRRNQPGYVVIANETGNHLSSLRELREAGYRGKVLVEKPLFHSAHGVADEFSGLDISVGYNLRFHPLLNQLAEALKGRQIHSANAYVGQHLSLWRRARDFKESYSSKRSQGGGVLRDLSHELDFLTWLFGRVRSLAANVGNYGDLGIDSEDSAALLLRTESCPSITVEMNYLDRVAQRSLTVNAEGASYRLDWIAGTLTSTGDGTPLSAKSADDRDATYSAMHQAILDGPASDPRLCGYAQGLEVVRLIEAAETAAQEKKWISL